MRVSTVAMLLLVGWLPTNATAQKHAAYTDAESAGPDFKIQGEYSGLISGGFRRQKIGIQLVAQGNGEFRDVEFAHGLPGDGWDGYGRFESDAKRYGNLIAFHDGRTGLVSGGNCGYEIPKAACSVCWKN